MKDKIVLFFVIIFLATKCFAKVDPDFLEILKKYSAYDVISLELKDSSSKEAILTYAESKIFLNSPDEALSILSNLYFKDPKNEGKKELLLARAYRMKGEFISALLHYCRASKLLPKKELLGENQLKNFFKIVLLKSTLDLIYNGSTTLQSSQLLEILKGAKSLWPKVTEWSYLENFLTGEFKSKISFSKGKDEIKKGLIIFLSSMSIGDKKGIVKGLNLITDPNQREILSILCDIILNKKEIYSRTYKELFKKYPKYLAYKDVVLSKISRQRDRWILKNSFEIIKKLKSEDNNLYDSIDIELTSPFISEKIKNTLKKIKISLLLRDQKFVELKEYIHNVDIKKLPICTKICILLLLKEIPSLDTIGIRPSEFKTICLFLEPFGFSMYNLDTYFNISLNELDKNIKHYPLDYLLRYAYLNKIFKNKNVDTYKEIVLLYKNTKLGQMAVLRLAQDAINRGNITLFKKYISLFDIKQLNERFVVKYYKLMADYYNVVDDIDNMLSYYDKIMELSPSILKPVELIKAGLVAQRNNRLDLALKIFGYLWKNKNNLDKKLQAEVLFWMAECAQMKGNLNVAVARYLKVYWYYRSEYIWSITALYRAALIYEQKGMYNTAQKILKDVIKNASRKTEKEAAKARLKAINKKINTNFNMLFWF